MRPKSITQAFNDGILSVYKIGNIAEPGNMPKDGLTLKFSNIQYEERTVGITRNSLAKQEQSEIEQLVRIPRIDGISVHDVVILTDGKQYDIYQSQNINNVEP